MSLKEINIPDSVEIIENQAFNYCLSLRELHIPDSVIYINKTAFDYNKDLERVYINIDKWQKDKLKEIFGSYVKILPLE